jgi:hypothetical protein
MNKQTALIWSLVSLGFLLAGVLAPIVELKLVAPGSYVRTDLFEARINVLNTNAFCLLLLADAFLVVSAFAGFAAVGAMNHGGDDSRHLARVRPLDALIWLLVISKQGEKPASRANSLPAQIWGQDVACARRCPLLPCRGVS